MSCHPLRDDEWLPMQYGLRTVLSGNKAVVEWYMNETYPKSTFVLCIVAMSIGCYVCYPSSVITSQKFILECKCHHIVGTVFYQNDSERYWNGLER